MAFVLDGDILLNEFFRIFIKKEKKFGIRNFLDEYSYTHRYILHLPLLVIPVVFITGLLYINFLFGLLLSCVILSHLIHDTLDNNFCGVSWFYPFNSYVYKFHHGSLQVKSRENLEEEARKMAKYPRSSRDIFKDNTMYKY